MTQADAIQAVYEELGPDTKVTKSNIEAVLKASANVGINTLADGGDFDLFGLGKIKPVTRAARKGRNPRTGEPIDIPEQQGAKFQPSKALKDALKA